MACPCQKKIYDRWKKSGPPVRTAYLDHAAGTPPDHAVIREYFALARKTFAHADSVHSEGIASRDTIETWKSSLESHHWFSGSKVFTAPSASAFFSRLPDFFPGRNFYCGQTAHPSVKQACHNKNAFLPVDNDGVIDLDKAAEIVKTPAIVICAAVNHETGAVQDPARLRQLWEDKDVLIAGDLVQAPGRLPFASFAAACDIFVLSPYKFGGMKSLSLAAFRKKSLNEAVLPDTPSLNLWPGPEDPVLFGAQAKSVLLWDGETEKNNIKKLSAMDAFFLRLLKSSDIPYFRNSPVSGAPGILNLSFPFISDMEKFFVAAAEAGICVGRFSACTGEISGESAILAAMGLNRERRTTSLRISAGPSSTEEDYRILASLLGILAREGN